MGDLNSQDMAPADRQRRDNAGTMGRATYVLHETIIRGLGILLEGYRQWLRSHRPPQ